MTKKKDIGGLMKCKCIELSDISEYEDNDSCKAKYTIMQLQQENK